MPLLAGAYMSVKYLRLDLYENTSRNDQAIQSFHRAGGGFENINHALMRAHLELLARLLINMRASQNRISLDPSRNRNGSTNAGVGPLGVIDDFLRRRIQRPV